ncbi:hypothetical protein B7495_00805 [Cryobacterium sp. LW097]|uniref:hypothetical protein n=1 Tax=unclassified Cryobacterium TaxID=2649013 RepID=UPI000B4CA19F|nr:MULTISPECIES: hypothetical protein [unclassified Cryobacterium]ASD20828.1 hypothetical protein B7495_00805 [Cryobacterium sp. LW097]TFC61312.1 hypothetical protein E3O60_04655 [Cryobacterium sp. TMB1-7]
MTEPGGPERPAFDPRHDARFQRGYQPGDPPRPAARPGLIGASPAKPAAAAGGAAAPFEDLVVGTDDAFDDLDALAFDGDTFQDELEPSRWNPYIALLWVVALALPAGGMVLQWQAVSGMFGNNSYTGNGEPPVAFVLQQFSYLVAPPLISSGIVILGGLLFWHAWGWRARRRRSAQGL